MSATADPTDDLDAIRAVIEAVEDFNQDDQQRIFRWAAEKLGLPPPFAASSAPAPQAQTPGSSSVTSPGSASPMPPAPGTRDIRSFVTTKSPRSDVQFAATVAYFYQFEAPESERKDTITGDDLQDACRKVGRERLKRPSKTLNNAQILGLLDKGTETGTYSLNTVGENLVAMTLPGDGNLGGKSAKRARKKAISKKTTTKKPGRKKAAKRA